MRVVVLDAVGEQESVTVAVALDGAAGQGDLLLTSPPPTFGRDPVPDANAATTIRPAMLGNFMIRNLRSDLVRTAGHPPPRAVDPGAHGAMSPLRRANLSVFSSTGALLFCRWGVAYHSAVLNGGQTTVSKLKQRRSGTCREANCASRRGDGVVSRPRAGCERCCHSIEQARCQVGLAELLHIRSAARLRVEGKTVGTNREPGGNGDGSHSDGDECGGLDWPWDRGHSSDDVDGVLLDDSIGGAGPGGDCDPPPAPGALNHPGTRD